MSVCESMQRRRRQDIVSISGQWTPRPHTMLPPPALIGHTSPGVCAPAPGKRRSRECSFNGNTPAPSVTFLSAIAHRGNELTTLKEAAAAANNAGHERLH